MWEIVSEDSEHITFAIVLLQLMAGVVQPLLLSILATSALAKTTASYPLPPISDWRSLSRTYVTLLRPMRYSILMAIAANVINASVMTYSESKAALRVQQKLTESHFFLSWLLWLSAVLFVRIQTENYVSLINYTMFVQWNLSIMLTYLSLWHVRLLSLLFVSVC